MITKREAYQYGLSRGYDAARSEAFRKRPRRQPHGYTLREAQDVLKEESLEAEMISRQYADFCNSNLYSMHWAYRWYDTVWKSYKQGVVDGIDNYIRNI